MREMPESLDLHGAMESLSQERPVFHSEADFQHALAWKLHQLVPQARLRLEYKPFPTERFYVDILLEIEGQATAIELKYPTRRLIVQANAERFELRDQAAQDITRYDFVKDLTRIERIAMTFPGSAGHAVLLTNDSAYWKEALRPDSVDAAFRLAERKRLAGSLAWAGHAGAGTMRGRGAELILEHSYELSWNDYSEFDGPSYGQFRYLLVSVPSGKVSQS